MSARLDIDEQRCMGHGMCYGAAPSLLSDDEEGYVAERGSPVAVPDEHLGEARQAARACPEHAVSLATSD